MTWASLFSLVRPRRNRCPSISGVPKRHVAVSSKTRLRSPSITNSTRPKSRMSGKIMRFSWGIKISSEATPIQRSPSRARVVPSSFLLIRMSPLAFPRSRLNRPAFSSNFDSPTPNENVRVVTALSPFVAKSPSKPWSSTITCISANPA